MVVDNLSHRPCHQEGGLLSHRPSHKDSNLSHRPSHHDNNEEVNEDERDKMTDWEKFNSES